MDEDRRIARLEKQILEAENTIKQMKSLNEILQLRAGIGSSSESVDSNVFELQNENIHLKEEVEQLKLRLVDLETMLGIPQVSVAVVPKPTSTSMDAVPTKEPEVAKETKTSKNIEKKKKESKPATQAKETATVDVSRLDMRIGQILEVKLHPDADTLYIEQIDVGEEKPRTVISGLVKHVPIEEMQGRLVIAMCNLKPAKMRGILSEAMVMCASSDKVELLIPPEGSVPGDRIIFDGYPGQPDAILNPKKKVWEQVQPDLYVDDNKVATYKGVPFKVEGKGECVAPTLAKVPIK